jgi:hypothetical protein
MFNDTEEIRIIKDAIELMQSENFSIPKNFPYKKFKLSKEPSVNVSICEKEDDHPQKASIYGAFACGVNVYLVSLIDADYTYSATSVHWRGPYHEEDKILCYFAFPRLGFAIPLCAGDVLFSYPREPHCLSTCVHHDDQIYCVSLCLKSDNIGKHHNGIQLTPHDDILPCVGKCISFTHHVSVNTSHLLLPTHSTYLTQFIRHC